MFSCQSGRGAARLARLHGVQEVGGSNPLAPTDEDKAAVQLRIIPAGLPPYLFDLLHKWAQYSHRAHRDL